MKIIFAVFLILIIPLNSYCTDLNTLLNETDINSIQQKSGGYNFAEKINELLSGSFEFDIVKYINDIYNKLIDAVSEHYASMILIIILAIFSAVVNNIKTSFKSVNDTMLFVIFSIITLNGLDYLIDCISLADETILNLLLFINALYPVMLTTVASGGGIAMSTAMHPVLMISGELVMFLIKSVVFPLLTTSVALELSNLMSDDHRVERLASFINGIIKWGVGIIMTVFVGVVSVTGAASKTVDTITVRTAKYAIGSFIPMVGGVISDSFDLVMNGFGIIKNSVGLAGVFNIIFICLAPALSLLAIGISFNLCAALTEPIADKKIVSLIGIFGKSVLTLFALVCACAVMFVLCTGILISLKTG